MSSLLNKVKDAVSGEKNTSNARAANQGNNGNTVLIPIIWFDLWLT